MHRKCLRYSPGRSTTYNHGGLIGEKGRVVIFKGDKLVPTTAHLSCQKGKRSRFTAAKFIKKPAKDSNFAGRGEKSMNRGKSREESSLVSIPLGRTFGCGK